MSALKPEDYLEPGCPLCGSESATHRIDLCRMTEKLDGYLSRNDYKSAQRHLDFWLEEAYFNNDLQGALAVYNEQMGLYRKCGYELQATEAAGKALELLDTLELTGTVTAATTRINVATVWKAFGRAEEALPHYRAAEEIYLRELSESDPRLGGLYNNLALALVDLKQFREADRCYRRALTIMAQAENGALEQAITWLNMANAAEDELGLMESDTIVSEYLATAEALLDLPHLPRNGYYAFVCEKCASSFRYFGHFAFADTLEARAREIYERS